MMDIIFFYYIHILSHYYYFRVGRKMNNKQLKQNICAAQTIK